MARWRDIGLTVGGYSFEGLARISKHLSPEARLGLVRFLGRMYGSFPHQKAKTTQHNLKKFLHFSGPALKKMKTEIFENYAIFLHDFFFPDDLDLYFPDRKKLESLRKTHGGVMLLTFHMGYWELGARAIKNWGWPITAIYQPYENPKFKSVIESRRFQGVNYIPVGQEAAKGVLHALRRGDVVAMVGDHPFGEEGTWVNLLGNRVRLPRGPVVLAAREKKPLVVGVIVKTGKRDYQAYLEDPLFPSHSSKGGIQQTVQEVANKYGNLIQKYPTQWYRFWSF